ncbi:MAG: hypothetical protein HC836_42255 [Richelia sp. RM2_1_2]|nr:hypothetical protein [Richelia sp. RM2_1_2]
MIIISHRGNINGVDIYENNPYKILEKAALLPDFHFEVDIWNHNGKYFLGHNGPLFDFDEKLLSIAPRLWFHCKNLDALRSIAKEKSKKWRWCKFFFHNQDYCAPVLIKNPENNIYFTYWVYPNLDCKSDGVIVHLDGPLHKKYNWMGVCTDNPVQWRNL